MKKPKMRCEKCKARAIKRGRRIYADGKQAQRWKCSRGHWFEIPLEKSALVL